MTSTNESNNWFSQLRHWVQLATGRPHLQRHFSWTSLTWFRPPWRLFFLPIGCGKLYREARKGAEAGWMLRPCNAICTQDHYKRQLFIWLFTFANITQYWARCEKIATANGFWVCLSYIYSYIYIYILTSLCSCSGVKWCKVEAATVWPLPRAHRTTSGRRRQLRHCCNQCRAAWIFRIVRSEVKNNPFSVSIWKSNMCCFNMKKSKHVPIPVLVFHYQKCPHCSRKNAKAWPILFSLCPLRQVVGHLLNIVHQRRHTTPKMKYG